MLYEHNNNYRSVIYKSFANNYSEGCNYDQNYTPNYTPQLGCNFDQNYTPNALWFEPQHIRGVIFIKITPNMGGVI